MKLKLILISVAALAYTSCGLHNDPSWTMQENPLDNGVTETWPASFGHFGPFGAGHPATGNWTRPINGGNGTVANPYFQP